MKNNPSVQKTNLEGSKELTRNNKPLLIRFWWICLPILGIVAFIVIVLPTLNKPKSPIVTTFMPETRNAFQYNSPTIVGNNIYIGTSTKLDLDENPGTVLKKLPENFFYKLDLDLKIVWKYDLGKSQVDGGATLDSLGNIYFVTIDYYSGYSSNRGKEFFFTDLQLVSLTNEGKFRWKYKISFDQEEWQHAMINCAIGEDDTIYVADSKLFAFSPNGELKWQFPADNSRFVGLRTSPIIDSNGFIYLVSPEPTSGQNDTSNILAYKFSQAGEPIWTTILDNQMLESEGGTQNGGGHTENVMYSSPAFSVGELSLYSAVGNTINRVDTKTGRILWSMKPDGATGSFKASPAVDNKDNLYIGSKSNKDSKLFAIKADGSGLLWVRNIGADMYVSPLLGDDGNLYIGSEGSEEGYFHVINMADGETKWAINQKPDFSFDSPALYKGFVYIGVYQVGPEGQALYKIKVDAYDYLPGAAWPRFHGSNSNTGRTN